MKKPTDDEKRAYLFSQEGWREDYMDGRGMRWTFYPRDRRRRVSDDYSLFMAYNLAISGELRN